MSKTILLAAILIVYATPSQEMKHAPVLEVCRADQAHWEAQLAKPSGSWATVANDLDSKTLVLWATEMNDCSKVDKDRGHTYVDTVHWLFAFLFNRESDFLIRHRSLDQFKQEDAAGAR